MAAKSTLRNMVRCLTAVCVLCGAVLGLVYAATYDAIEAASLKALQASIGEVLPEGGEISEAMSCGDEGQTYEYYVSSREGETLAYAVKSTVSGFGGPLTLMVGVLPDGTVYNTSVLSHSETPGLGAKCATDAAFVEQWKNFPASKVLKVKKDGGDVDAITASTITSRAYTLAVANAVAVVKYLEGGSDGVDAASGASY